MTEGALAEPHPVPPPVATRDTLSTFTRGLLAATNAAQDDMSEALDPDSQASSEWEEPSVSDEEFINDIPSDSQFDSDDDF